MKRIIPGLVLLINGLIIGGCAPKPVDISLEQERYVIEGQGATVQLNAWPVDKDGNKLTEDVSITYFCGNRDILSVTNDGMVTAAASGEDTVEVEVVGTDLKKEIDVRVKIPSDIEVSHEKLRLWVGQEKTDVSAHVLSEKGAYLEGYFPEWSSDDPSVVSVEQIEDPAQTKYKRSYVKMVGLKSGDTYVYASHGGMQKRITVRVYSEDEEVTLAGRRISAEETEEKEEDNQ